MTIRSRVAVATAAALAGTIAAPVLAQVQKSAAAKSGTADHAAR